MTSIIAHMLTHKTVINHGTGRLIRFGQSTSSTLTRGPLMERVISCLRGASVPMRLADISEAINDCDSRSKKILNKLVKSGIVEATGEAGFDQRFRLR